jgi:hypothetical protein
MAIAEIGLDDSYDKILKFAANAISAPGSTSEEKQRYATYVAAATSVFVANRLDKALSVLRETTEASGRMQADAAMQAAKLLADASDRATAAASSSAERNDSVGRSLRNATWVLAFATFLLVAATAALVFQPGA